MLSLDETYGAIDIVFLGKLGIDLRSRTFVMVGFAVLLSFLSQDLPRRTANIIRHRARLRPRQPRRGPDVDQIDYANRPCELDYDTESEIDCYEKIDSKLY